MDMMMDLCINTSDMSDMRQSPARGKEKWWVFLVTSALIYIVSLSLCSIAYGLYRIITKKKKKEKKKDEDSNSRTNDNEKKSNYKIFHEYIRNLISGDTIASKVILSVTLICNIMYIGLAVVRSYPPHLPEECFTFAREPAIIIELLVVIELIMFSILRFLATDNIIFYWFSVHTIVDVFTLPHIFVSIALGVDWIGLRSLRFFWMTQIVTVLQLTPLVRSQNIVDGINLLIYFLILWLTSSGIIHLVETQGDPWRGFENGDSSHTLLVYVYYIMVTMSTVGYGDILPLTDLGRTFMTFFIIGGLAFFAAILPKLIDLTSFYYAKTQYASFNTSRVSRHVIVCGHITAVTAEDFLKDFLHPDRGDNLTHVLFLHPDRPDSDLKNALHSHYTRVQFLLGSVMNGHDLEKAKIHKSAAIFILANKHTDNPTKEDHANLMRVVSVKNTTTRVQVIIQVLHSFSKKQVYNIEGWRDGRDIALCLNEMKLGLLAQSCLCPGFSTLIANLFYTSDFNGLNFSPEEEWKRDYIEGASNEIYSSSFSPFFEGKTFHQAADICYNDLNLVLLALEHIEIKQHNYYVNPSPKTYPNLTIRPEFMLGYFIAPDQDSVSAVESYCTCCPDHKHTTMPGNTNAVKSLRRLRHRISTSKLETGFGKTTVIPLQVQSKEGKNIITFGSVETEEPRPKVTSIVYANSIGEDEDDTNSSTLSSESVKLDFPRKRSFNYDSESSDAEDDDTGEKFELHVCEPNRLEESILNLDKFLFDNVALKPNTDISDHIILCIFADGNSPILGLHTFLKPLRSKQLSKDAISPVVIISDKSFIEKEWPIIRSIPDVHVVVGSPLRWSNLKAAKVAKCSVCVVLTALPSSDHEPAMNDKEAILCSLSIQKKLKNSRKPFQIITDLRLESNVQFLDFGDDDEPDERIYKAQPFACGEAFSVSMFDSVTSSAFHGPGTLYLIENLIHASGTKTRCQVNLAPIAGTGFEEQEFGDYYNSLLQKHIVCMGLSRKLPNTNNQRYVITCPRKELILNESDIAFLLT